MMTNSEFIVKLKESLETDDNISLQTNLNNLAYYDSLSILSLIVLIDENFNKKLSADQFKSITTVQSLVDLIGKENISG